MYSSNQEQQLEINAGHGDGITLIQLNDQLKAISKKANLIEAIAYLELIIFSLTNEGFNYILPQLYQLIVLDDHSNEYLNTVDILSIQDQAQKIHNINALLELLRSMHFNDDQEYTVKLYIELLTDDSQNEISTKNLDVKLGAMTFSDSEAIYNVIRDKKNKVIKTKSLINKSQMSLNELLARQGGALHFQISNSSNVIMRQFSYYYSYTTLQDYLEQFELKSLYKIKTKLELILNFVIQTNLSMLGSSLFYYGDEIRLIDLAHYLSPNAFDDSLKEDYDLFHQNLLNALKEQIFIVAEKIETKAVQKLDVTTTSPGTLFDANQQQANQKVPLLNLKYF